ncbi:MAG TPA: M1 family aminopeptidase [Kofleriaceae bacterium]|jgi:aminopeptidase N
MKRLICVALVACGGSSPHSTDAPADAASTPATANADRDVTDTKLAFDVSAMTATATVTFAPSTTPGATLEVGDLVLNAVKIDGARIPFAQHVTSVASTVDLGVPASDQPIAVEFDYAYKTHEQFQGASAGGYTFIWPFFCGNLFPCHSQPSDGTTFSSIALTGVPAGKTAIVAPAITVDAPSYMFAWTIDAYTELPLGTTTAGTHLSVWYRDGELADATTGTADSVAAFDWLEKNIGPYRFGDRAGSVSIGWPAGAYGGMEHHPFWHVSSRDLANKDTNVHESAHGWFGDGVRIACWEDFVLSEGTVSYLAAKSLEVVDADAGAAAWASNQTQLAALHGNQPVWPQSCNQIDILNDGLYSNAPYMRGAFFYRAVELKYGAQPVIDALHEFFMANQGKAAKMSDMITTLEAHTGDLTACVNTWLLSTTLPTPGPCP